MPTSEKKKKIALGLTHQQILRNEVERHLKIDRDSMDCDVLGQGRATCSSNAACIVKFCGTRKGFQMRPATKN